jgi:hypothetical protein
MKKEKGKVIIEEDTRILFNKYKNLVFIESII